MAADAAERLGAQHLVERLRADSVFFQFEQDAQFVIDSRIVASHQETRMLEVIFERQETCAAVGQGAQPSERATKLVCVDMWGPSVGADDIVIAQKTGPPTGQREKVRRASPSVAGGALTCPSDGMGTHESPDEIVGA